MSQVHPHPDPRVTRWLYSVAVITFCLIVAGGFVRLTRSGLSIVEWNPIVGVLPPIGEAAWNAEFAKYQTTPEFREVNHAMTLDGYQRIFLIEWGHRLIARIAGLAVVVPLGWFLWCGLIPIRQAGLYVGIALLFGLQGFLGWFMVSSGLFDRPSVSHYRLTIHLLMATLLLAIATWAALNRDSRLPAAVRRPGGSTASRVALALLSAVTLQIAWGGLVAGLKAGHVSYTWPLMGGAILPAGVFAGTGESWWHTATANAPAVHWIHRWFALVVVSLAVWLVFACGGTTSAAARRLAHLVAALVGIQILLGVSVLWFHVPLALAWPHQALGLGVFTAALMTTHRLLRDA